MRQIICFVAVRLVAVAVLSTFVASQTGADSLAVGSVVLRLGDSKSRVIAGLGKQYELQLTSQSSGEQLLLVKDKEEPTSSVYAAVMFDKGGLLVTATKYWLPESRVHEPADVVLAIYGVIEGFIKKDNRTCVIKSDEHHSPGPIKETKMVMVRCGL